MKRVDYLSPTAWALLERVVEAEERAPEESYFDLCEKDLPAAQELRQKELANPVILQSTPREVKYGIELYQSGKDYFHLNKLSARLYVRFANILWGAVGGIISGTIVSLLVNWMGVFK